MKYRVTAMTCLLAAGCPLWAEAPTIRSVDMFYQVGEYFRAYANDFDPDVAASRYAVPSNLIKPAGEDLTWDFSTGPVEVVHRFDYLDPAGLLEALEFPLATVAERKTVEQTGQEAWLFFEQVSGVGRKVYGFYDEAFSFYTPAGVFDPPIIDFPETIRFGQAWGTDMTVYSTYDYSFTDPEEGELSVSWPVKMDFHSTFTADAWGTAFLPGLGLLDVLRVNEEQAVDISLDLAIDPSEAGSYTFIETDYMRNYYWLSPGHGIAAQLNSTQGTSLPADEFTTASVFLRMFETNKKAGTVDDEVKPVDDLQVIINKTTGKVAIRWSEALNAGRYRVEYSTGGLAAEDWQPLPSGETTDTLVLDPAGLGQGSRFYRVVSLP